MKFQVYEQPESQSVTATLTLPRDEFAAFAARHSAAIMNKLVDRCVEDLMQSASVQARLRAIRAEFPSRVEDAIAKAVTAALRGAR